ncbi:MAG: amidohydrolase [Desulfobacterales bacterium]|nr:amidohydrolase [Desulfobacterales bacterium]MBF0399049.1 amidohydrolase [Desulfobacterales bacterium]
MKITTVYKKLRFQLYSFLIFAIFIMSFFCSCNHTNINKEAFNNSIKGADMIFYGGNIITVDDNKPKAEAIAIYNGKILVVGRENEVFKYQHEMTKIIDLRGKTLMPGFIASHTHPDLSAYLYTFIDLSGFTNLTPEDVWSKLKKAVDNSKPGKWIICRGFDPMLVPGLKAPKISDIDAIAPENPVAIIAQSMHSAWFNSLAFKKLGITNSTPDPAPGSYYQKDKQGKLTGFVAETAAIQPLTKTVMGMLNMKSNIIKVLEDYSRKGFSSIITAGLYSENRKLLLLYEHLSTGHPKITHRMLQMIGLLPYRTPTVRHFIYIKSDTPHLLPDSVENGDDFFKIIGVKFWYDGSPYTGSMYIKEPYLDSKLMKEGLIIQSGSVGKSVIEKNKFYEQVSNFHKKGWQLAVHAQGDRAIEDVIQVYEKIMTATPIHNPRHRIEHVLLFPPKSIEKAKSLGISLSFHINHLYYYGLALQKDIIGPIRTSSMLPVGSAQRLNLIYSIHADQPMYPEDPLSLLTTAVTRKTKEGIMIGIEEKISVMEAIKSLTIYAAWQIGMDDKLGSISPGKYADLVILDKNPLEIDPNNIRNINIIETIVNGVKVWPNHE